MHNSSRNTGEVRNPPGPGVVMGQGLHPGGRALVEPGHCWDRILSETSDLKIKENNEWSASILFLGTGTAQFLCDVDTKQQLHPLLSFIIDTTRQTLSTISKNIYGNT